MVFNHMKPFAGVALEMQLFQEDGFDPFCE
jgi:hypothetical protein